MKRYTTESSAYFLDDINWSHTFLMNSMDDNHQETVHITLSKTYPGESVSGPLTFALMIDQIINLSENAIESMIKHSKDYDIKLIPRENIEKICRRFQYALKKLQNNESLSKDLITALFKVFQTTSISEYNEMFKYWKRSLDILGVERGPYQDTLDKALEWFSNMRIAGEWKIGSIKSSFKSEVDSNAGSESTWEDCKKAWSQPPDNTCIKVSFSPERWEKKIGSKTVTQKTKNTIYDSDIWCFFFVLF